jgi:RimJ/RimL family protein N-acetyltransferase
MIETERLMLRQFQESDAEDVFEYLHQPAVHCFYNMKLDSLEDAKAEMKKRAQNDMYLAIVLKGSNKVIGELFSFAEGTDPESEVMDNYSPCWMLNLVYSGKGYAHEAAHAYFDYLFNERGARRIYAYTEDTNLPSQHLCERLGMRREGLFMEFVSFINNPDGTPLYENTVQYAILKREWEERKCSS